MRLFSVSLSVNSLPPLTTVKSSCLTLVALLLITSSLFSYADQATVEFTKSQLQIADNFSYSGRIDFNQVPGPYLTWPGTSVKFRFTGNQLRLKLNDDNGRNLFNVIFNGQNQTPYVLAAKKGLHEYNLSHMINTEVTTVEIFKRTEGDEGGTHLVAVKLGQNAKLLTAPVSPTRKIVFYGDSITAGMGNEAPHNTGDSNPVDKNHYLSYAAITARNLNAEFQSIAKSGIGFMISWFDFIMPQYYDQLTGENDNQSQWDFNRWQPDVVVVNLGQNDSWLIDDQKRLTATPEQIVRAYTNFIQTLQEKHPNAYFICALGSMDATDFNNRDNHWPEYITTAVHNIKQQAKANGQATNIDTLMFRFTGYGAHPRVNQHVDNADKLTAFIKQKLSW